MRMMGFKGISTFSCCVVAATALIYIVFPTTCIAQSSQIVNDSVVAAVAPEYDSVSSFHRFWLGESYRKLWAAPVKMRVFHITSEKGGLTIVRMGGGVQTKSLRLREANGKEWVLRTIQKYPERGLAPNLKKTIAKDILQDQVVTGHPYAALTVPPFAKALGLPHASPEIVYVPDDAALGQYRSEFANSVLLFEEREPSDTLSTSGTDKVQEKAEDDNDVHIDQKLVLRARLLDLLVGDWDRHEDQWRWQKQKENGETIYTPIPRDRDKVYYNTTGVLPWFLSHQWLKSNLQGFHNDIRDIEGYNYNNRYFDRYFLTQLSEDDWKEQIGYVEKTITDSLIRTAVRLMPDTIYALSGDWIIRTLINRRAILRKEALKYYRFLSRYVDIPGTNKHEAFDIQYKGDGKVEVTIYKIKKDGTKQMAIFRREFSPQVTKEIRLYGLGGNDIFSVSGQERSPIKIRMIGGDDKDSFYINKEVNNKRKLVIYDRSDEKNILPSHGALIRTSTDSAVNAYERKTFKYDYFGPVFFVQYNLDQGVQLSAGLIKEKQGFRKKPYASRQEFSGQYSTQRRSWLFSYSADIKKIFGNTGLNINLLSHGPRNVSNFFGIGNETRFIKTDGKEIDYYRNRFDYFNADVRLNWYISEHFRMNTGVAAQYYTSSATNNFNHFLKDYDVANPGKNVFTNRFYAGLVAGAELNTRNNLMLPSKGLYWLAEIRGMKQTNEEKYSYGLFYTNFDFYIPVLKDTNIVLATRIGGGTTMGKPAFFQQMQLGGIRNLRGYHSIRFTGKSMFFHNVELRAKLFDFTSYLFPGSIGLIAFNDVGRVWVPGEASSKWHDGYGGGIYIVPSDLVLIQALLGHSKEGTLPYISFGFSF